MKKQHPKYGAAVDSYLNSSKLYLKNMYIMRKECFDAYCQWLFPVLEIFDIQNHWTKYHGDVVALRVDGYLAERLFGIWYTKQQQENQLRSAALSRVHFSQLDGGNGTLRAMQKINGFLPPGTRRRSLVSRCARYWLRKKK